MFNFTVKEFLLGGDTGTPTLQFYKRGFELNSNGESPSWQDIILSGNTALTLTNALANGLNYLKLFGGTEQRNIPSEYTQVNYVTNTAQTLIDTGVKFDFSKNYEIELKVRGVISSWYILQARENASSTIYGISGSQNNNTIILSFNGANINTTQVTRVTGNIYYIKATINNGNLTLYVKDETADTEETVTGNYTVTTGQSANIGLFGNLAQQYVGIDSDVYFARIKEDDNYILNYVSCRQGTTAGFYDKASSTFKTTTDLVADGDTLPSPDTPIDIVCNNGVVKVSPNLLDANVSSISITAIPTDAVSIDFSKWYEGVAFNGYMLEDYINAFSSGIGTITITGKDSSYGCVKFLKLKPNTTYTISCSNPTNKHKAAIMCYIDNGDNTYTATTQIATPRFLPFSFTTNNNLVYGIDLYSPENVSITYTNLQVEEGGTNTTYIPYGTTYTDGTTETVEVHGKNLFDKNTMVLSCSVETLGQLTGYHTGQRTAVIPVQPNTRYAFSWSTASRTRVALYTTEPTYGSTGGTVVDSINLNGTSSGTFTTANDTHWVAIWYVSTNGSIITADDFPAITNSVQLELGSTATTYEPYYSGGTATAQDLYAVGTYKDVQSVLDGAVTRQIAIQVLNGTENWAYSGDVDNAFYLTGSVGQISGAPLYCTHFQGVSALSADLQIRTGGGWRFLIRYNAMNSDTATFKQFLADQYAQGTPVIIVYPLATATTESVTAQSLTTQAGTNIITAQGSIDNLGLEVSYKATI